jgi:hypothetical protein
LIILRNEPTTFGKTYGHVNPSFTTIRAFKATYRRAGAVIKLHAQIDATSEQSGEEYIWTQDGRGASPNITVI